MICRIENFIAFFSLLIGDGDEYDDVPSFSIGNSKVNEIKNELSRFMHDASIQ